MKQVIGTKVIKFKCIPVNITFSKAHKNVNI